MTNIHDEIRAYLEAHCDSTYRAFQIKLIPNIDPATITGVRTPDLRKLAKKLAQHDEVNKFLSNTPHTLFEENQLHAFIIAETRDYDTLVARIQAFLPFVNNWATCDQLSPKGLAPILQQR